MVKIHGYTRMQPTSSPNQCLWINPNKSTFTLTLIQLEVISLCHQNRTRSASACTSEKSDQALYCWLTNFKSLKLIMGNSINIRWIIQFMKFSRLRLFFYIYFCFIYLFIYFSKNVESVKTKHNQNLK